MGITIAFLLVNDLFWFVSIRSIIDICFLYKNHSKTYLNKKNKQYSFFKKLIYKPYMNDIPKIWTFSYYLILVIMAIRSCLLIIQIIDKDFLLLGKTITELELNVFFLFFYEGYYLIMTEFVRCKYDDSQHLHKLIYGDKSFNYHRDKKQNKSK